MAQRKLPNRDRTRRKPLTLAALEEYGAFAGLVPPAERFDPQGSWRHSYRLWLVASGGLALKPADMHYRGFLEIQRRPSPDGEGIMLYVRQSILQQTPGVHDTTAEIRCAADALASPQRWKLTHAVRDGRLKPVPEGRLEQTGSLADRTLRMDYAHGGIRSTELPKAPLTSNWSLLDAVQRLPRAPMHPLEFAMLQELDQLKPSQRITYRGAGQHTLDGKPLTLHHYQHTGRGILPYNYYTDDGGRLLVAVGGLRAYVFDPNVIQLHDQCLATLAGRAAS